MIIQRVGQPPFEIKRGDRVSYFGKNVTVRGISESRKKVRIESDGAVRKGGYEVDYGYIYPPQPETSKIPLRPQESLSTTVRKINRKNEPRGGWNEGDKIV